MTTQTNNTTQTTKWLGSYVKDLVTLQSEHQEQAGVKFADIAEYLPIAVLDEVAEYYGHDNRWKWWKGGAGASWGLTEQQANRMLLEVADILHFTLIYLAECPYEVITDVSHSPAGVIPTIHGLPYLVRELAYNTSNKTPGTVTNLLTVIERAAHDVGKTTDELVLQYVGKLALNKVRMKNGYSDGKYTKHWCVGDDGEQLEDNDVLQAYVAKNISEGDILGYGIMGLHDRILADLEAIYAQVPQVLFHQKIHMRVLDF